MNQQQRLQKLMAKYGEEGIYRGSIFLSPPVVALALADELEAQEVLIYNVEVWRRIQLEDGTVGFHEDYNMCFDVLKYVSKGRDYVKESMPLIRAFIEQLPLEITHVSFVTEPAIPRQE